MEHVLRRGEGKYGRSFNETRSDDGSREPVYHSMGCGLGFRSCRVVHMHHNDQCPQFSGRTAKKSSLCCNEWVAVLRRVRGYGHRPCISGSPEGAPHIGEKLKIIFISSRKNRQEAKQCSIISVNDTFPNKGSPVQSHSSHQ